MILAVNVILLQFLNWMSYGVDGFAYATESLVGKYKGANLPIQLKDTIRLNFMWGMLLAVFFSLLYWLLGEQLLWVFTDQVDVVEASKAYLKWMVLLPIIGTPCYIWDGVFIGLIAGKAMRNTMLLAVGIYLFSFWLVPSSWGNHGLWLVLLVFMFARGFLQSIWFWLKHENLR